MTRFGTLLRYARQNTRSHESRLELLLPPYPLQGGRNSRHPSTVVHVQGGKSNSMMRARASHRCAGPCLLGLAILFSTVPMPFAVEATWEGGAVEVPLCVLVSSPPGAIVSSSALAGIIQGIQDVNSQTCEAMPGCGANLNWEGKCWQAALHL
jgi:hypothetical protein